MPDRVECKEDLTHVMDAFSDIGFEVDKRENLSCNRLMEVLEDGM